MRVQRSVMCVAGMALMVAACASGAHDPDVDPDASTPASNQETPPSPSNPPSQVSSPVAAALADLARRLNVPASEIEVVSEAARVWGDGSLGCPQPGMNYAQVQIEGFQVVLKHGARTYDYRFGSSAMILCEQDIAQPDATAQPSAPAEPELQPLVDQARADLAQRLSVDVADVELVSAESVVWPDSSLGCPMPGMQYLQLLIEGARIRLRVGGKLYSYHSGRGRGPFLCDDPSR